MGPYICHVIIRFSLNKLKPLDQIGPITALFVKYHLYLRTWKFAFDLKFAVHKYSLFWYVTTLPKSGRRPKLSSSDEKKIVWMLKSNSGTTKAQSCHELETAEHQHHFL